MTDPTLRMYVLLLTSLNQETLDILLQAEPIVSRFPLKSKPQFLSPLVANAFFRMQRSNNTAIVDDPIAYSILMKKYDKLDKPDDCERLLYELETMTTLVEEYPTLIHFNIAIHARRSSVSKELIGYMHETELMEGGGAASIAPGRIATHPRSRLACKAE
jgi:hypothetical protein